jgi:hypothetical protein
MTDKPVRRDRYPVKGEQKSEVGRVRSVRRANIRPDGRADVRVCGSHSLRLFLLRSVAPTQEAREQKDALEFKRHLPDFADLLPEIAIR